MTLLILKLNYIFLKVRISQYKLCADCKPKDDVSVSYLQSRCITTILSKEM